MQAIAIIANHESDAAPELGLIKAKLGITKAKLGIAKAKLALAKAPHVIAHVAVAKEVKTKAKIALAKTAAAVSIHTSVHPPG